MKSLDSYKTWRAIEKDLRKEGFDEIYWSSFMRAVDGGYNRDYLQWDNCSSTFSCAIPEWGCFESAPEVVQYWPYVIKHYLLKTKPKFVRCSTTAKQPKELSEGLFDNGFIPTGQVKSSHGRYMVYMWEYWK